MFCSLNSLSGGGGSSDCSLGRARNAPRTRGSERGARSEEPHWQWHCVAVALQCVRDGHANLAAGGGWQVAHAGAAQCPDSPEYDTMYDTIVDS